MANRQNKKATRYLRGAARIRIEYEDYLSNLANQGYGAGTNTQKGRKERKGIVCPTSALSETPHQQVARGVTRVYLVDGGHDGFIDHHADITKAEDETWKGIAKDKLTKMAAMANDMIKFFVSDLGPGASDGPNNVMVSLDVESSSYTGFRGDPSHGVHNNLRVQGNVAGAYFLPGSGIGGDSEALAKLAWGTEGALSSDVRVGKSLTRGPLTEDTQIPGAFVPATTRVTSPFGMRTLNGETRMHNGIDFSGGKRTTSGLGPKEIATKPEHIEPCYAAFAGKVSIVKMDFAPKGYGCWIQIDHEVTDKGGNPRSIKTRYAHIEATGLKYGDVVEKGDKVGHIGSQGGSTGPHLHFEALENGKRLDPIPLFGWVVATETPSTDGVAESDMPEENLDDEPDAR